MQIISNIYDTQYAVSVTIPNDMTSSKINNSQDVLIYNSTSFSINNMSSNQGVIIQDDPQVILEVYKS